MIFLGFWMLQLMFGAKLPQQLVTQNNHFIMSYDSRVEFTWAIFLRYVALIMLAWYSIRSWTGMVGSKWCPS
jgi:hypothetical protein